MKYILHLTTDNYIVVIINIYIFRNVEINCSTPTIFTSRCCIIIVCGTTSEYSMLFLESVGYGVINIFKITLYICDLTKIVYGHLKTWFLWETITLSCLIIIIFFFIVYSWTICFQSTTLFSRTNRSTTLFSRTNRTCYAWYSKVGGIKFGSRVWFSLLVSMVHWLFSGRFLF